MYTYFSKDQLIEFGRDILKHNKIEAFIDNNDVDIWCKDNPDLFQPTLPPIFHWGQEVEFVLNGYGTRARIHAIHLLPGSVKYDLDLYLPNDEKQRIYNVSAALIARPEWKREKPISEQLRDIWK